METRDGCGSFSWLAALEDCRERDIYKQSYLLVNRLSTSEERVGDALWEMNSWTDDGNQGEKGLSRLPDRFITQAKG